MKTIFFVIGETASGKDVITSSLKNWFDAPNNLKKVVSYTTRNKRDNETEGVEHYFVDDEKYDEIHDLNEIIAETTIGKYRYMATKEELMTSDIYLIDPCGYLEMLSNDMFQKIRPVVIYIYAPFEERLERAKASRSDFNNEFMARFEAEHESFDEFYKEKLFDYVIYNNNGFLEASINTMEQIMNFELNQ